MGAMPSVQRFASLSFAIYDKLTRVRAEIRDILLLGDAMQPLRNGFEKVYPKKVARHSKKKTPPRNPTTQLVQLDGVAPGRGCEPCGKEMKD